MKTITFLCDHCGVSISTPAQNAGQTGKCPNCGQNVVIPPSSTFPPPGFKMPEEKSAGTAIGLNLLLFGCGYFYLGEAGGGVACLLLDCLVVGLAVAGFPGALGLSVLFQIVGICDVATRCDKIKKERAALMDRLQQWREMQTLKRCPYCGENIQKSALLCRFCGSRLDEGEETV